LANTTFLKIKPVGGVGQIGSNMTLLISTSDIVLIDAGILFPFEDFFDIDYLVPDLADIPTPTHLVITHGHEDHIGAVFHIIKTFPNIKITAPSFTASLIRKKLEYNKTPHAISIYHDNETLDFNEFTIDPIHVNHSIPQTNSLLIRDKHKSIGIFFTSDFKIDFKTRYEKPFDFEKLIRLSKDLPQRILLADSTNITSSQLLTPSEEDLIPVFEDIFKNAENRIFITCFSSNIHRLMTFLDLAEKYEFKVVPHGRSMISYLKSAQEEGILVNYEKVVREPSSVKNTDINVIVLLSGCQGDFMGTFRRVAMGEDSTFKPRATDTFILSSKAIPGNEKKITQLTNRLSEIGCKVITAADKLVHVSGHPGKKDLTLLYEKFTPTDIVPIHGETLFLRAHVDYIKSTYPQASAHFLQNFDEIHIDRSLSLKIVQGEKKEPLIIHGKHILLEREKISERRKLACNGVVFLSLRINAFKNKIETHQHQFVGLPLFVTEQNDHFFKFISSQLSGFNFKDPERSKEDLRVAIRRYFDNIIGYKPMTYIHLL
jgi:ribonuclease J